VTDVCLKRKVRNHVQLAKGDKKEKGYDIYVKEKAVLGRAHVKAFKELGIQLGEEHKAPISRQAYEGLSEMGVPEGLSLDGDEENNTFFITVASDADKKEIKDWLKENKPIKAIKDAVGEAIKQAKSRRPSGEEVERGRGKMCEKFYDIRTFGAVLHSEICPQLWAGTGTGATHFCAKYRPDRPFGAQHYPYGGCYGGRG